MYECKVSKFQFLLGIKLGDFGASLLVDNSLYKQLVGSLLYLTESWSVLEYGVGIFIDINYPHDIHCKDKKRILHYVQGTKHFGVHYVVGSPLELVGFIDSDWTGDPIDKKYTSRYVLILTNGPIFCSSKKKHTISLSSAKSIIEEQQTQLHNVCGCKVFLENLVLYLIYP